MRNLFAKVIKTSSIALLSILLLFSMCFGALFCSEGYRNVSISEESQTTQTNEYAEHLFEHLYLDTQQNSNLRASNILGDTRYGTKMKLVDFDISSLGDTEMDYIVVVAFVNLADSDIKWKQSDIDNIMLALNDDDPTNNIYSVREYFKEQTYGKLKFKAGYVKFDSSESFTAFANRDTNEKATESYELEANVYKDALDDAKYCYIDEEEVTDFHCRLLYYPYESDNWGTMLWPHAWSGQALVSSPRVIVNGSQKDESPFVGTYAHEFTHILGVADLYCAEKNYTIDPVGSWYLMASTNYNYPQSINAYFKSQFGLTGISKYGYNDDSKVREITGSGEYLLASANSQTGVIAFKFAERDIKVSGKCTGQGCLKHSVANTSYTEDGKEMFFVEYKKRATNQNETDYSIPSSGLIIYRVIESYHAQEFGNLYPDVLGEAKFQVYVLRPNGMTTTEGAVIGESISFGSTATDSSNNKLISYYDGTNSRIVIKNNGYDKDGNAKVEFTFAEDIARYSASGILKVDGKATAGAKVMVATPSNDGGYNADIDSGVVTDENGYFFVSGLKDKSKISFLKDGKAYSSTLTINGSNIFDRTISEKTIYDVTLRFFTNESNVQVPLQGVEITNIETLEHIGTSNADGIAELKLKLGDRLSFKLDGYNINDWTFTDSTKTENISIQGGVKITTDKVQIKVVNEFGEALNAEFTDITTDYTVLYAEAGENGSYFIQASIGAKIRVYVNGYAPKTFFVEENDYTHLREITLYQYQTATIKIYNAKNDPIAGVTVQVDGETVGFTNPLGELLIDEIYIGQKLTFEHNLYKIADYVFDGKQKIELQAEYKTVKVRLQFYKPKSFIEDNIIPIESVNTNLTIVVNSISASISTYEGMLCFDAIFYSSVYFNSSLYAITNKNGEFLMAGTSGIPLIIDPETAVKKDDAEGYVVYYLFAKKYIDLSGTVTFPEGAKVQKVEIFIGGKRIAESDSEGNFTLEHVVEGDEIIFKCDGYTFSPYYVVDTTAPMEIVANPKDPFEYLAIYILFGVLALCFIIPFFVGLRRKKNPLVDIDKMQYDNLEGQSKKSKKDKKNKK